MADPLGPGGGPGARAGGPALSEGAPASGLDRARLEALIDGAGLARRLVVLDEVDSTNDETRRRAAAGAPAGTVVVADRQTAGRGRLGRAWHSAPGVGLYLSVLLRPGGAPEDATRWTLVAAVAACEACHDAGAAAVAIEWPNDLVAGARKLGGVLAEMRTRASRVEELVLGFGINVSHGPEDFPPALRGEATSLARWTAAGTAPDRERLAADCLGRLSELAAAVDAGEWQRVAGRWEMLAPAARGARVRLTGEGPAIGGWTAGLDPRGRLLVRGEDGRLRTVHQAGALRAEVE